MPTSIPEINAELIRLRDERRAIETQLTKTQTAIRALYRKRTELLRQECLQKGGINVPEDQPTIAELELFI